MTKIAFKMRQIGHFLKKPPRPKLLTYISLILGHYCVQKCWEIQSDIFFAWKTKWRGVLCQSIIQYTRTTLNLVFLLLLPRIAKIHKSYSLPPTHPQIDSRIFLDHSHFQIAQDHRYHPLADAYGHTAYSIPQIDQKLFQLINETGPTPTQLLFVHSFILKYWFFNKNLCTQTPCRLWQVVRYLHLSRPGQHSQSWVHNQLLQIDPRILSDYSHFHVSD